MDGQIDTTTGIKHDSGKENWALLPYDALNEVVKVLDFGANKYGAYNWAKGLSYSRVYSAIIRHLWKWWMRKEDLDPETNISHLAHACCGVLFLLSYVQRGMKKEDDRP